MADCESVVPENEGEENLITATKQILRAWESKENLTDDAKKILVDLATRLFTITTVCENEGEGMTEIEEGLNVVQETIMSWEVDQICDLGLDEYLNAANEAQKLTKRLESLCLKKDDEEKGLLRRAQTVLQKGMARLEKEFRHMLIQNRQHYEPWNMSFRSSEEDVMDERSLHSFGDLSVEDSPYKESVSGASQEFNIDLIYPDAIPHLRGIANLMFNANYNHECTRTYINIRKNVMDEYLSNIHVEDLNTDDVLMEEWVRLDFKIKRWGLAMKKFVRVNLAREKELSYQIFGEIGSINLECFVEVSKASMLQLLNFGQAISVAPYKPEKLVHILVIYEVLADLLPEVDSLYTDEAGSSIRIGCREVQRRFSDFAWATFLEFKNYITSFPSRKPVEEGGIHPLTRYVMNYIKALLTDYTETLNLIFKDHNGGGSITLSSDMSPIMEKENENENSSHKLSSLALLLQSIASDLQSHLYDQSKLYEDASLQYIFLMNNVHYITRKFENPKLKPIIGDDWIQKHIQKFQQHLMDYERTTWTSILTFLMDELFTNAASFKFKLQSFNIDFEEVCKAHAAWVIPDVQLRNDLRISVSAKVTPAYFSFIYRFSNYRSIELPKKRREKRRKLIKYTADDINSHLLNLFEGSGIPKIT